MNQLKSLSLICLFTLLSQGLFAEKHVLSSSSSSSAECCHPCTLGNSGFSTTSPSFWYTLDTPVFPNTVPLSINGNFGSKQGKVQVTSTGLKILEEGNYSVSFSAILTHNDPNYTPLIPVFVVRNGIFKPNDTSQVGGVVSLPAGIVNTVQGTGILQNVKAGTTLSLVATNGGSPQPEDITVISWAISVFKIPCEQK